MSGADRSPAETPLVCLCTIQAPHGVRGLVRLRPHTDVPEDVAAYGPLQDRSGRAYILRLKGRSKGSLLAAVDGVADRDAAERLKGTDLYVPRDRLPATDDADEFYLADLVGLAVLRQDDGLTLGRVRAVPNYGAGDLLEVAPEGGGQTVLLPFTRDVVPEIDLAGGLVRVDPPAGLWPDPAGAATGEEMSGATPEEPA